MCWSGVDLFSGQMARVVRQLSPTKFLLGFDAFDSESEVSLGRYEAEMVQDVDALRSDAQTIFELVEGRQHQVQIFLGGVALHHGLVNQR